MISHAIHKYARQARCLALSLSRRDRNPASLRLLQIVVYSWTLLATLLLLPAAEEFWGAEALIARVPPSGFFAFLDALSLPGLGPLYPLVIALQIFFLSLRIAGRGGRPAGALVWALTMVLDNRAWITLDGGNNLMHLLLFYLIFAEPAPFARQRESRGAAGNVLNNLVLLACRVQVVTVYVGAGLTKLTGPLWQHGVALYYVLNTDEYTHPLAKAVVGHLPWAIVLGTYLTLVFQVSFPWLIWNQKARPWLVAVGTFLHLQISFVMGLFLFGLAMCASYVAFTPEESARRKLEWLGIRGSRLSVAFDMGCAVCLRFARLIRFLDRGGRIIAEDARRPASARLAEIPLALRLRSMQAVRSDGRAFEGFGAVAEIVAHLPFLSLLHPALRAIGACGWGDRLYARIAQSSRWRETCRAGACELTRARLE